MPQPNRRQWISTAVLGLVMFAGDYGCLFWAEKEVPSGLAAVIAATIPVWVLLGEWLFAGSQRPTAKSLAGIVLGIAGVVLLMLPAGLHNSGFSLSALVLLSGCFFWAGGTVASRHLHLPRQLSMSCRPADGLGRRLSSPALRRHGGAGQIAGALPSVGLAHWRSPWPTSSCFASIIAFTAYVWLIARDPTTRVASYAYVNPLIALLLGSLLADERPTPIAVRGSRAGGGRRGLHHCRKACCTA